MKQTVARAPRLAYLDITKGILVVLMVVYHSLNYTNQYYLGFRYLAFLPLSFVLITGYLLSTVYSPRYRARDSGLAFRLVTRGLKLFVLFTILNIAAQFVRSPAYGRSIGVGQFVESWYDIYITGGSRLAAFEILLPIAYLLVLARWLIALAHWHVYFLPAASALIVVGCALLDRAGISLANLGFVSVGLVGMIIGQIYPDLSRLGRFFALGLLAYGAYFLLSLAWSWSILTQLLGALVALALIIATSVRLGEVGWCQQRLIRIGQYSLIAYIAQIGILQILSRFLGRPDPVSVEALIYFGGTLVMMTVTIEFTIWLRRRNRTADRLYTLVFA